MRINGHNITSGIKSDHDIQLHAQKPILYVQEILTKKRNYVGIW